MTDALQITRATATDVPLALPLLLAQFAEHAIALPPTEAESALQGLVTEPHRGTMLLAREGVGLTTVVGLAVVAYTWTVEHGGRVAWLDELYVVPRCRSRGVGAALLRAVQDLARTDGCRALELEVEADHLRAAGLYVRAGFERLSRTRYSLSLRVKVSDGV